jgi:general secretion pathway protein D
MSASIQTAYAQDPAQNATTLNFVGADIETVVKAIGHYTGTTFIIDPRVKGQITLVSEKPLTKDQAFKLLTSNLRLQGFAVVTADGYAKVVPEADAKLQAGPTQAEGVKGDQIVTQVYRLNYESPNNVLTVLRPLISGNNTINVNPGNNSVVITDYSDNQKRLAKIISLIDVPSNNELDVLPIQHGIASDVAAIVNRMMESGGASEGPRSVIIADPRTNSLLVRAPTVAKSTIIKNIVAKLDTPSTVPGNIHVVYLKNAEAAKLAVTLRSILSGDTSGNSLNSSTPALSGVNTQVGGQNIPNTGVGPLNPNSGNGMSNFSSSLSSNASNGNMTGGGFIQADAATNTLIITASDAVYRNLRKVIDQLDARRAQVYIETLIVEVSADKANELGVQWMGATGDRNSNNRLGAATSFASDGNNLFNLIGGNTSKLGSVLPGAGLTVGLFNQAGGQLGIGALARALATDGSSNILSIPNLVTLDNEEAKMHVGQNVPFITGQFTTSAGGTGGANPFQTIERKDVGIKLNVRPQISDGGTVKLQIFQEVSSAVESSAKNASGIITNTRSITTNILAEDGQLIVLGGLIGDDTTEGESKVPLLGDIPFIGNLFKYQSKTRKKTNLMVFLRPVVIRSADQSQSLSLDRYDYLRTQTTTGGEVILPNMKIDKGLLMNPEPAVKAKTDIKENK